MPRYRGQKVRYRRRGVVRLQLRQLLETRAVSPYGLAKFTGLSLNTIYRLTRPNGRFGLIRGAAPGRGARRSTRCARNRATGGGAARIPPGGRGGTPQARRTRTVPPPPRRRRPGAARTPGAAPGRPAADGVSSAPAHPRRTPPDAPYTPTCRRWRTAPPRPRPRARWFRPRSTGYTPRTGGGSPSGRRRGWAAHARCRPLGRSCRTARDTPSTPR